MLGSSLLVLLPIKAQMELTVRLQDGTQQAYLLSSLRKITFSNNGLTLIGNDTSELPFLFSSVDKMFFSTQTSNIETDITNGNELNIYPNPASDVIYINMGDQEISDIFVYRLDGVLILTARILSSNEPVNVGGLPSGFYMVRVGNQILKLRKL